MRSKLKEKSVCQFTRILVYLVSLAMDSFLARNKAKVLLRKWDAISRLSPQQQILGCEGSRCVLSYSLCKHFKAASSRKPTQTKEALISFFLIFKTHLLKVKISTCLFSLSHIAGSTSFWTLYNCPKSKVSGRIGVDLQLCQNNFLVG